MTLLAVNPKQWFDIYNACNMTISQGARDTSCVHQTSLPLNDENKFCPCFWQTTSKHINLNQQRVGDLLRFDFTVSAFMARVLHRA